MRERTIISLGCLFLIVLTFGLYYNSLDNSFHYDDGHTVVDNPWIRDLKNLPKFFLSNTLVSESPQAGNYRPLLMVTYAINYALGGLDPWGFHLVNVLLHVLIVLVCFGLNLSLLGDLRAAVLGAMVFALHPINAEAVNYITARSSLLSTFFILVAVFAFHLFRLQQKKGLVTRSWLFYSVSLLSFLFALSSKETAIILPGLILLTDLAFHSDRFRGSYKQTFFLYMPWIGLTLCFFWMRGEIIGGISEMIVAGSGLQEPQPSANAVFSLLTGLKVLGLYISTAIWPMNLAVDHNLTRVVNPWEGALLFSVSMMGILITCVFWFWKRQRIISFSILWFFISLLPVLYLPFFTNTALFQENRGYTGMMGFAILLGWAFRPLVWEGSKQPYKVVGTFLVVVLLGFYMTITLQRNAVWQDQFTLWSDAVKKSPLSPEPHISLAMLYRGKGDLDSSFQQIQEALRLAPEHGLALHLLGDVYSQQGQLEKAVDAYEHSLRVAPGSWKTYTNLGAVLAKQGRMEQAVERYRQALRLNPNDWIAHQNLIAAYARQGQILPILKEYEESASSNPGAFYYQYGRALAYETLNRVEDATAAYQKSTELNPGFVEGFIRLCQLYMETGNYTAAHQHCERVLKIDSQNWAAHYTLGLIAEQKDELEAAIKHYLEALRINPRDFGTHFNLGNVYRRTGQTEQATLAYRTSLELNPDFLRARFNLAKLLEQKGERLEAAEQYRQIALRAKEGKDEMIKGLALDNLGQLNHLLQRE